MTLPEDYGELKEFTNQLLPEIKAQAMLIHCPAVDCKAINERGEAPAPGRGPDGLALWIDLGTNPAVDAGIGNERDRRGGDDREDEAAAGRAEGQTQAPPDPGSYPPQQHRNVAAEGSLQMRRCSAPDR